MPKSSWPGARAARFCRAAQSVVRRTASSCSRAREVGRQHLVEAHGDVRAEGGLDLRGELGREARRRAVVDRAEGDAFVVDRGDRVAQREDLVAARIGQDRAVPAHEAVEPAELGDQLVAGPEEEVVGVAEDDVRAERPHLVGVERLDRRLRPDRHERRRRDVAVRGAEDRPRAPLPSVAVTVKLTGSASHRRRSRSGSAPRPRAGRGARVSSAPAKAITSASSVERGRWKLVSSASTRRNSKPGQDEELGAAGERRAARERLEHAHRRRPDREHPLGRLDPLPRLGPHLVALAVQRRGARGRPRSRGRNVSSPTWSVTRSTSSCARSSGVKWSPAVGAAAEPGSRE